jgi:hypothetical protein
MKKAEGFCMILLRQMESSGRGPPRNNQSIDNIARLPTLLNERCMLFKHLA